MVFLVHVSDAQEAAGHVLGFEDETLGVLFLGTCGLILIAVPFIDVGPRSRRVLNGFAFVSVVFMVIMTVWGVLE